MKKRDFISITNLTAKEIGFIIKHAIKLKIKRQKGDSKNAILQNKTLVMIFEKPSLRTRLSFEAGMTQLGGHAVYLGPTDIGLGIRESVADIAKVASSMGDIIMARTFSHDAIVELAKFSSVPVINALSDLEHPCQILADFQTIFEVKKRLRGLTIAFLGDGNNNVTHTMVLGAMMMGMHFRCASPKGYWMDKKIVTKAEELVEKTKSEIVQTTDPKAAAKNADIIVTDTWVSMGSEKEKAKRLKIFKPYQVNNTIMKLAKKDAIFMHCLPAYRGKEVTEGVIDGPQSVVFQEAENRLHAQKALILFLLGIR
jgi:ornithine carbamoyltransferase